MSKQVQTKLAFQCKDRSPLFELLNAAEMELIEANYEEVIFNPGETILKKGTPGTHVLSISKGLAKFYLEGKERNIIIRLLKAGELFSAPGSMIKTMLPFSLAAIEKTQICFIDNKIFKEVMESNTAFRERFLGNIHQNLNQIIEKLVSLNTKNSLGRLAESLLYLSQEVYQSNSFKLTISKTELTELAGISKEGGSRILNELDQDNLIYRNGDIIEIIKPELLQEISRRG